MRVGLRTTRKKRAKREKPAAASGGIRFYQIIIVSFELHIIVVMLVVASGLLESQPPPPDNRVDIVSIKDIVPPEAKLPPPASPVQAPPKEETTETKSSPEPAKAAPDPTVLNEKLEEADDSFTGMSVPSSGVSSPTGSARAGKASGSSGDNYDDYMPQYNIDELPSISENDVLSRIEYPTLAAKQGIEATVYLELFINSSGRIVHINVLKDPGFGFTEAAVKALLNLVCTPAKMEGKPVAVRYRYPVHFKLM
jgi:TonB family protein